MEVHVRGFGKAAPVREEHSHLASQPIALLEPECAGDRRSPAIGADHPPRLDRLSRLGDDASHGVGARAAADEAGDSLAKASLGACCEGRVEQGLVEHEPAGCRAQGVAGDRRERA